MDHIGCQLTPMMGFEKELLLLARTDSVSSKRLTKSSLQVTSPTKLQKYCDSVKTYVKMDA